MSMHVVASGEVSDALRGGRPVVALESTIFSHLGLPSPFNAEALDRCSAAIRDAGCVPAVTAILDGVVRLGLEDAEHARILGAARKVAERDIAVAVAQRWEFGATTVSAAVAIAAAGGVAVFATGG
ncbi:MAG: pseudouridine-5'-phosphate glycosidase, partial [Acidimicrobiia bacterium]|nr:pseudouridine-5'-phosphate glycosidase [Acidimicrobiia bacterium]